MNPIFPIIGIVLLGAFLTRKKQTATGGAASDPSWDPAWGAAGEWDRAYPDADPSRPLPVMQSDIHPDLWKKWLRIGAELQRLGYNPQIFEAGRTQRRQAWLYGQGRPEFPGGREGQKVTWTLNSNHPERPARALDIIDGETGWSDPDFFSALGVLAVRYGLTWGGSWEQRDYPHIEL